MTWTATISGHVDLSHVPSIKEVEAKIAQAFAEFRDKVTAIEQAGVEYATFNESHGTSPEAPNQTHMAPPPEPAPSDQLPAPVTSIADVAPSPVTDGSSVPEAHDSSSSDPSSGTAPG
jgi:hypothetical protein